MKGKPHKIDIVSLYAKSKNTEWNNFLSLCLKTQNLSALEKVLYGLELGMNDLAKKKMNTEKLIAFFLRLQRSIELTMKQIIKDREPHPLDDPLNKDSFGHLIESKKDRDMKIEKYLKRVRF